MKLLTLARDLKRRRARERQGLFVAEGTRAVEELVRSGLRLRGALVAPELSASPRGAAVRAALLAHGVPVEEVADRDFADAAGTESPQGVLAIAEVPVRPLPTLALPPRALLLVLDAVQDPGNAGTLLRTAAAFGAAATLALPGTVDLWNAKVVRSAMGALFHRPALSITWEQFDEFRAENDVVAWGADNEGDAVDTVASPARLALVVGNEGSGLSPDACARVARRVRVPIDPSVDSLNVAVAAGILLHHFRQ